MSMLKNITFSVEEEVIAKAREAAKEHDTTLNEMARDWLREVADRRTRRDHIRKFLASFEGVDFGPKMTREEMNARR
jgi:hypothetical protein